MRVISQKGMPVMTDIPYEKVAISQSMIEPNKIVAWDFFGGEDNIILMAKYSTPEKSEKAMRMLHKLYAKLPDAISEVEKKIYITGCFNGVGDEYVEPERSDYFVFRFPQEDEI